MSACLHIMKCELASTLVISYSSMNPMNFQDPDLIKFQSKLQMIVIIKRMVLKKNVSDKSFCLFRNIDYGNDCFCV